MRIELRDGGGERRLDEQRNGSLIEEESACAELEVDLRLSLGVICPHEGVPGGGGGEERNEGGVKGVAEPRPPHTLALQLSR